MIRSLQYILVLLLLPTFSIVGISQNFTLTTQAEVDAFDETITVIDGNLQIRSANNTADPIVDLFPLNNVTTITGGLFIHSNKHLVNLNDFKNLVSVGSLLSIRSNDNLTEINGFDNLVEINGNLDIVSNNNLLTINGFNNLTTLIGTTTIGSYFGFGHNLKEISGFSSLETVGSLIFSKNGFLEQINAFENVTTIEGNLTFFQNYNLTTFDNFKNLTTIGGKLTINQNVLVDLNGCKNLTFVGGDLTIDYNPNLTNCCGIQKLFSLPNAIGGEVKFVDNPFECNSETSIINNDCSNTVKTIQFPCLDANNGFLALDFCYAMPPLSYNWIKIEDGTTGNGSSNSSIVTLNNLSIGTYQVTVTDILGRILVSENISLFPEIGTLFEIIEIETTNSSFDIENGGITLKITGGFPPYAFEWNGPESGSLLDSNHVFKLPYLPSGAYQLNVRDNVGNHKSATVALENDVFAIPPCNQPLDIVILNDVSSSVNNTEYEESKQFLVDLVNAMNIGITPEDNQAAIIEWSGGVAAPTGVQVPMTGDLSALQNYINLDRTSEGGTGLISALKYGKEYLTNHNRPNASRVIILTTDADSTQADNSLVELAKEYQNSGFHIVTVGIDRAFSVTITRDILMQVASLDNYYVGAPSYSDLNVDLATYIADNLICPIPSGATTLTTFHRDGAIELLAIKSFEICPAARSVELTFSIEAFETLSIPPNTPVSFYDENPELSNANNLFNWLIPCEIIAGTTDEFTLTFPINSTNDIFAVLNNSGNPPTNFSETIIEEISYKNNSSRISLGENISTTNQITKYNLPNVFSPNQDGINDCFQPYFSSNTRIEKYRLSVFNRWGSLVFSSNSPAECWQGNFNEKNAEAGVYVWFLEMKTENCEQSYFLEGDVLLIRH